MRQTADREKERLRGKNIRGRMPGQASGTGAPIVRLDSMLSASPSPSLPSEFPPTVRRGDSNRPSSHSLGIVVPAVAPRSPRRSPRWSRRRRQARLFHRLAVVIGPVQPAEDGGGDSVIDVAADASVHLLRFEKLVGRLPQAGCLNRCFQELVIQSIASIPSSFTFLFSVLRLIPRKSAALVFTPPQRPRAPSIRACSVD